MHSHEATAKGLPRNDVQARVSAEGAVPNFVGCRVKKCPRCLQPVSE